jgi:hypothetical protein
MLNSPAGEGYEHVSVVLPEPGLSSKLYAGASNKGYAAFKVKINDANPLLAYGRNYDGTKGTWFKLK